MFNKFKQARDHHTNYVTLRNMAASKNPRLRAVVAANRNLQTYVMEELGSDRSAAVRVALAANPNVTAKLWDVLKEDSSEAVRTTLVEHHPERPAKAGLRG